MDWDEPKTKSPREIMLGEELATLSVGELQSRIEALQAEIARIEAEIMKKRAHEAAASAFFKS